MNRNSLAILSLLLITLGSCATEQRHLSSPEIKMPVRERTTLAITDVFQGEERVAVVRTIREEQGKNIYLTVADRHGRPVGLIRDGVAMRSTAHDGLVAVSSSSRRAVQVAAILGMPADAPLVLKDDDRIQR